MPLFGTVDVAILVPLGASIVGAGFGIAWRLGSMDRNIRDLADDVAELKKRLDAQPRWGRRVGDWPVNPHQGPPAA